ncbi:MAG TPA: DsbE family thiol:disulfide interchange protein [Caulobacteraceae bacterium]|nr:DsbE family thiol:disulfide interchange protein [Caulobacteraceae bacterium]
MKRLVALAPVLALTALIAVFAGYALHHDPRVIPRATVGQPAPDVLLPGLAGGAPVAVRSALKGPTLVNFFASWCVPCAEETPALAALKAEGVPIVGVAWKDDPAKIRDFLARYGDPYSALFVDRNGRAGIDFGVTGAPETYVIGADGRILDKAAGAITAAQAEGMLKRAGA